MRMLLLILTLTRTFRTSKRILSKLQYSGIDSARGRHTGHGFRAGVKKTVLDESKGPKITDHLPQNSNNNITSEQFIAIVNGNA